MCIRARHCGFPRRSVLVDLRQVPLEPDIPVSYTHLDVYKRQELRNVRKEGAVRRAIRQFDGNGCLQRERTETQNLSLIHI